MCELKGSIFPSFSIVYRKINTNNELETNIDYIHTELEKILKEYNLNMEAHVYRKNGDKIGVKRAEAEEDNSISKYYSPKQSKN